MRVNKTILFYKLFFSFFIFYQFSFSQKGSLKGYIYDIQKKERIGFTTIKIIELNKYGVSDFDGNFLIKNIPIGIYNVNIRYPLRIDTTFTSIKISQDSITELNVEFLFYCKYDNNNKTCPVCNKKNNVTRIVYGYPSLKLLKAASKGKVKLGGCVITDCDPKWYCSKDKIEF